MNISKTNQKIMFFEILERQIKMVFLKKKEELFLGHLKKI